MTVKAIETEYNGYRFRSRLEARWAVFFDEIGIEYQYEPEGFDLGNGIYYLPDFYIPEADAWIEIKGKYPTKTELEKMHLFCKQACANGTKFRILYGQIPQAPRYYLPVPKNEWVGRCFKTDNYQIERCGIPCLSYVDTNYKDTGLPGKLICFFPEVDESGGFVRMMWRYEKLFDNSNRFDNALKKARSARFEHGEKGGRQA